MPKVINRSTEGIKDRKVWRYMSISKFISLIRTSSICFSRLSCFEDPNEGRTIDDDKLMTLIRTSIKEGYPIEGFENSELVDLLEAKERYKNNSFISCWHLNEEESVAMWDIYVGKNEPGIAIQTTIATLDSLFPWKIDKSKLSITDKFNKEVWQEKMWFSMRKVEYCYESEEAFKRNSKVRFSNIFIKRPCFSYENEFRVSINLDNVEGDYLFVNLDLKDLINRVYISPRVDKWIRDELVELIKIYNSRFNFLENEENQIIQSSIFDDRKK